MSVYTCVQVLMVASKGQWIPLERELQGVVSFCTWMLGTKLKSSKIANTPN